MKTLLITLILCCLLPGQWLAQNYREDVLAVSKMLLGQKSYSMQLHYDLYLDGNMANAFQRRDVKIVRQGQNLYMKQNSEMEVIETKAYRILIDHGNKVFSATEKENVKNSDQLRAGTGQLMGMYMDTLASNFESIKVVYNDAATIKYQCTFKPGNEIAVVWVEIDKKLKLYRSLTTQYREKRKLNELDKKEHSVTLTVRYSGFSGSPVIQPALFSETSYLELKNTAVIRPVKKFATYRYLNSH